MFRTKLNILVLVAVLVAGVLAANANPCKPGDTDYQMGQPMALTMIAGSSAMWQSMALGAYNSGKGTADAVPPADWNGVDKYTFHYVSKDKLNVVDTRVCAFSNDATCKSGISPISDAGNAWVVWDSNNDGAGTCTPNVWAFVKTDSTVGNRAYFGAASNNAYSVYLECAGGTAPLSGNCPANDDSQIITAFWGSGYALPAQIAAMFDNHRGTTDAPNRVTVGATDIRPEDAFFATTRTNSKFTSSNGLAGLGYGINDAGQAPPNCSGSTRMATRGQLVGTTIMGDTAASGGSFNVVAFNLLGRDPFTCAALPDSFSTLSIGASPVIVIHSNNGGQLAGLKNVGEIELQQVFSGMKNTAGVFADCPACAGFTAFVREPLSGTYNTFDETIMRHPSSLAVYRASMERNNGIEGGAVLNNPLNSGGDYRYRAIGTGNMVSAVFAHSPNSGADAIGFTFFSYGNVNSISNKENYSYVTVNNIDPIFHNYVKGTFDITDPGQPGGGKIPGVANLPKTCEGGAGAWPCNVSHIWAADNYSIVNGDVIPSYSFPNLRNGSYSAWSILRLIAGDATGFAQNLIDTSNQYVVTTTPDYVPFAPTYDSTGALVDPGFQFERSHFGCTDATCGKTGSLRNAAKQATCGIERGRDAGGAVLPLGDCTTGYTVDGPGGVVAFR